MLLVHTRGDEGAVVSVMQRFWLCLAFTCVPSTDGAAICCHTAAPHRSFPARPRFLCTVHSVLLFVSRYCLRLSDSTTIVEYTDYRTDRNSLISE